jgi:hypothetical protein
MKQCNTCKKTKSLDEFPVNIAMKDNKSRYCKSCKKKRTKELYDKKMAERKLYDIF